MFHVLCAVEKEQADVAERNITSQMTQPDKGDCELCTGTYHC